MLKKLIIYSMVLFSINAIEKNAMAEVKNLTLEQILKLTWENNPKIKVEKEKLKINDAEILSAKSIPNPTALLEISPIQSNYKFGFQNTIETYDKRAFIINEAQEKKRLSELEFLITSNEIKNNAKKLFYELYILQQKKLELQKLVLLTDQLVKIAEKKELLGDIPKIDTMQAKLAQINLKTEVIKIEINLQKIKSDLNMLIGLNSKLPDDFIALKPAEKISTCLDFIANKSNNDKKIEILINLALNERLELKENSLKSDLLFSQAELIKANAIPNIDFSSGIDILSETTLKAGLFTNMSIELPIFNLKQGELEQIKAQNLVNDLEKTSLENTIKEEVKSAYNLFLLNANLKKDYEKTIMPLSLELLKKYQLSFESGKANIIFVLNSQQTLINNQLNYLQVLNDYYKSIIELERSVQCI